MFLWPGQKPSQLLIFTRMGKFNRLMLVLTTFWLVTPVLWAQEAAPAAATKPATSSFMMQVPMILLLVALFYFAFIAPQKKQAKQQVDFQSTLSKGDEVVTSSGIIGTIVGLTDRVVTLEVSPGTEIRMLRAQVQTKLKEIQLAGAKV